MAGDDGWSPRYRPRVGTKAERRAARERVAAYHEARLAELIEHITAAIDRYRTGEIDAYVVDETIHHYHRAARELWKFCWSGGGGTHIEIIAHLLDQMATEGETINWWERATAATTRLILLRARKLTTTADRSPQTFVPGATLGVGWAVTRRWVGNQPCRRHLSPTVGITRRSA